MNEIILHQKHFLEVVINDFIHSDLLGDDNLLSWNLIGEIIIF